MDTDFLIVGAGFFGTTVAERLASSGKKVLVIDKREHIGGNCYSEMNATVRVECHKYGSHIFHTSNNRGNRSQGLLSSKQFRNYSPPQNLKK